MNSEKNDENYAKLQISYEEMRIRLKQDLEKSKQSDYRLYGGMRATLIFSPKCGLPNSEELNMLCLNIQPMMYTQLWRKWQPINIPVSTELISVIGFSKRSPRRSRRERYRLSKFKLYK